MASKAGSRYFRKISVKSRGVWTSQEHGQIGCSVWIKTKTAASTIDGPGGPRLETFTASTSTAEKKLAEIGLCLYHQKIDYSLVNKPTNLLILQFKWVALGLASLAHVISDLLPISRPYFVRRLD